MNQVYANLAGLLLVLLAWVGIGAAIACVVGRIMKCGRGRYDN